MTAVEALLPDVHKAARLVAARCWLPASMDVDDLVQLGTVGLLEAAGRFRPDGGASLRTFAFKRLNGAMRDGIRAAHPLSRTHRRALRDGLAAPFEVLPLDAAVAVAAPGIAADDRVLVAELLATLPSRWRDVLERHYLHGESVDAIARACGITSGRVSQLKKKALARLRKQVA